MLNVIGKYDNGSDDWLDYNGNKNEWAVAYHGVRRENAPQVIHNIVKEGFKPGPNQVHGDCININSFNSDETVGNGVYCSPNPKVMETYTLSYNGYKMSLMLRVKPQRIRFCKCEPEYWVLNGKSNEMRPYRILVKGKK